MGNIKKNVDEKFVLLAMAFVVFFVLANITAFKQFQFGAITLTAGIIMFPFTFLITDVINEVYGKEKAQMLVYYGFGFMIAAAILLKITVALPPAHFFKFQEEFALVLSGTFRILLASLVAFLFSQTYDVFIFDLLSHKTDGKHLWLRNNVSTITSQIIDSTLFVLVAFYGIIPNSAIIPMITSALGFKWLVAVLETPLCYLAVRWAKK